MVWVRADPDNSAHKVNPRLAVGADDHLLDIHSLPSSINRRDTSSVFLCTAQVKCL